VSGVEDCVELGCAGVEGEGGVSGVDVSEVRFYATRSIHIVLLCFTLAWICLNASPYIKSKTSRKYLESHLLQLLVQIARSLMETNHTRHTHRTTLQVRHTSRDPVGTHAHSRKPVNASFCAQVVDLLWRGIQFEERVVNGAGNGLGERIIWPLAALDGGDS
jgi:hypothetical protein